jgi:phosphatidylglycerol:prolipoprotein diacylglycerol transferase
VLLGGVIGGVVAAYAYARAKKLPWLLVFDVLTPSLVIGIAIGRIGCFLNGCCFGFPTDLPWGCTFPEGSLAGSVYPNTPVHPTQFYEMLLMLVLLIILLRYDRVSHPQGRTFALFLMAYGVARGWVEGLRWYESDKIAGYIGSFRLTGSQVVSAFMLIGGIFLWIYAARKKIPQQKSES